MLVARAKALDRSYGFDETVSPLYGKYPFLFFSSGTVVLDSDFGSSCCPVKKVPVTIIFTPSYTLHFF